MKQKRPVHGGDWAGFEEEYGCRPMDFSANISPLGLPEAVKDAIIAGLDDAELYPDPFCRALVREIAAYEGVDKDHCLCGNGAADLLFRMTAALKPMDALVTAPAFSEYESALEAAGCRVRRYALKEEKDFRLDDGFLDAVTEGTEAVFLCQPNNPTGVTDPKEMLVRILEQCRQVGAVLVMDECFNDFLDEPGQHTMKEYIRSHGNLLILRSFTKMYAMAGIRLGYCMCSDSGILEKMMRMGQPWAVSHIAQRAGLAGLHEEKYVEAVRSIIREERPRIMERLQALNLRVIPGEANYLLFKGDPGLDERLRRHGFMIRNCGNYHGLEEGWYRIAVKTRKENDMLMDALKRTLSEGEDNIWEM